MDDGRPDGQNRGKRLILIATGLGLVLGVGLGAAAVLDAPVDVFIIAFGVALIAAPIVPVVVGLVRATGHPGEGWRRFWGGFFAALGMELVIFLTTYGTCTVIAQGQF
jgi:hypothetical protein